WRGRSSGVSTAVGGHGGVDGGDEGGCGDEGGVVVMELMARR
nr:hypothetical protein [Tanacetum cinerariifolium]